MQFHKPSGIHVPFAANRANLMDHRQSQSVPLDSLVRQFTNHMALQYHQFSKQGLQTMKRIIARQEERRQMKRIEIIQRFRKKKVLPPRAQPSPSQDQNPSLLQPAGATLNPATSELQESRLAKINRIKDTMYNKKGEGDEEKWSQKQLQVVFQNFAKDLRPQILNKYPSATPDRVSMVIKQKWSSIDPLKKENYTNKIVNRYRLEQRETADNAGEEPQTEEASEVKREEMEGEIVPEPQSGEQTDGRFGEYLKKKKKVGEGEGEGEGEEEEIIGEIMPERPTQAKSEEPDKNDDTSQNESRQNDQLILQQQQSIASQVKEEISKADQPKLKEEQDLEDEE